MGWQVSEIGFGAWAIGGDMWGSQDDAKSIEALHTAIDQGVNFIDTAQGYGKGHSETIIGNVLQERKETLYVATKVPPVPGNPWPIPENYSSFKAFPADYIIKECEKSLKRLKRDYIDIYQFHTWASVFNVEDGWFEAMQKLKADGKIRAIGVSVPDTAPDSVIGALVNERVDSVQVIFNLFEQYPRWNLFKVAEKMKAGIIVRVPFDEGALTGKFTNNHTFQEGDVRNHYFRGNNLKETIKKVKKIENYRDSHYSAWTMPEFALRYCLSETAVSTVIPGIRNKAQALANTAVSDGELIQQDEMKALEQFYWRKDFWHEEL